MHINKMKLQHRNIVTVILWIFTVNPVSLVRAHATTESNQVNVITALIRYSYMDADTGEHVHKQGQFGRYGSSSPVNPVSGLLVHVQGEHGANHGCSSVVNGPSSSSVQGDWVALIQRGHCPFDTKILNSATFSNASAVVVYDNEEADYLITMDHKVDHVVSVFIGKSDGELLASLADSGVEVQLDISIGQITVYDVVSNGVFKASTLLAVTVSLVSLLILGLLILLVCGIRKRKYNSSIEKNSPQANKTVIFNMKKPGQVHASLLSEIDGHEHSSGGNTLPV